MINKQLLKDSFVNNIELGKFSEAFSQMFNALKVIVKFAIFWVPIWLRIFILFESKRSH